jgi:ABC-type nickel/cobalt efflux system permease component RcnA
MRAAFRLLMMIAVLWCGVHLDEPAHAFEKVQQHQFQDAPESNGDGQADHNGSSQAAHVHHHCPLAAEHRPGIDTAEPRLASDILFHVRVAVLHSLSQAPPVEPPAA